MEWHAGVPPRAPHRRRHALPLGFTPCHPPTRQVHELAQRHGCELHETVWAIHQQVSEEDERDSMAPARFPGSGPSPLSGWDVLGGRVIDRVSAKVRRSFGLDEDLGSIGLLVAPRWHPGMIAQVLLGSETWGLSSRDVVCLHLGGLTGQCPRPGGRCWEPHGGRRDDAVLVLHGGAVLTLTPSGVHDREWDAAKGQMLARVVGPWF